MLVGACSSASPKMTVLGVKAPRIQQVDKPVMKVFVEVHNPSGRNLNLRRLEYRLVARDWFDAKGQVSVQRVIAAGASAVVEIAVPVAERPQASSARGVPYTLDARLFAVADKTERSWKLSSRGDLASRGGRARPIQVADRY